MTVTLWYQMVWEKLIKKKFDWKHWF
jgi:hypothetical protein